MSMILDIAVAAIVLIFIFTSAKKGFVKTVVEAVGLVAAIILAFTLSTPIAEFTYDKMIGPAIVNVLEKNTADTAEATSEQIIGILPEAIRESASGFGISLEEIAGNITSEVGNNTEAIIERVSEDAVKPIAVKIIGMALTVILFFLLSIVVNFLARVLNGLFSFSIVGKLNRTLGGVIGLVKGIVIAAVFCTMITFIVTVLGNGFWIFTLENIQKTYIFKMLAELSGIISF